jgi:DNA-binding CsgD family transcriptional regulator
MKVPVLGVFSLLLAAFHGGTACGQAFGVVFSQQHLTVSIVDLLLIIVGALLLASMKGKLIIAHDSAPSGQSMMSAPDTLNTRLETLAQQSGLTAREREILRIWARGHTSAYVEQNLHISKNTVKTHLTHIYNKTGAGSREELLSLLED